MKKFIVTVAIASTIACGKSNDLTGSNPPSANTYSDDGIAEASASPRNTTCSLKASITIRGKLIQATGFWTNTNNTHGFLTKVGTTDRIIPVTSPFSMVKVPIVQDTVYTLSLTVAKKNGDILCTSTVSPVTF